jgi:polar amino acid transport system permease protein
MQPPSAPTPVTVGDRGSRALGRPRRTRRDTRNIGIAMLSTLVVVGILVFLVVSAPGFQLVRERFFSGEHLARAFPSVARFFLINVRLFLLSEVLVLVFGLLLAVLRSLPGPVFFPFRVLAIAYIDFFRGIPLLLLLFIVAFGLPGLGLGAISGLSTFAYGVIALTMVYSAYVAEVYRAGIDSIHESQTAAARSLGLSRGQALRFVVLPQAIRRVIPPLLNDFIGLQKDTALVATVGLVEGVRTAQAYSTRYFNFGGFVVAAIVFVAITIPMARFTDYLIARDQRKMRAGGAR